jgi:hypothetical protein
MQASLGDRGELLYSNLLGANSAPHTPMVTGPGPLDCFHAFLLSGRSRLAGRGLGPFHVRPLFCFFFFVVGFFTVSFSHFLFLLFFKFLNRNKIENRIKIQIRTNFKVATNFKSKKKLNWNKFQIETNFKLEQFSN